MAIQGAAPVGAVGGTQAVGVTQAVAQVVAQGVVGVAACVGIILKIRRNKKLIM